ncbi:hypothetical protein GCK32_022071, partial [Trichostrongylus colubriformis]
QGKRLPKRRILENRFVDFSEALRTLKILAMVLKILNDISHFN